jgi:UDP:flavonoid glycosyltransferase YjiC (YdhE family)
VLSNPLYRQNAKQLQTEIAQYHSADLAANLLETLAKTKKPIHN